MSDDIIKLAAGLPKEMTLNGFAAGLLADRLCGEVTEGRVPDLITAVLILDVKKVEVDPESGHSTAVLRIRRAQPVLSDAGRRTIEGVLFDEYSMENGPVLSPEVQAVTKLAFASLPRTPEQIDEMEERERDGMSPADELRKHLTVIHSHTAAFTLTDTEAEQFHQQEHETPGAMAEGFEHDVTWHGWTRADIELNAGDGAEDES